MPKKKRNRLGTWIAIGLVAGIVCGLFFGEYCGFLHTAGQAYVGLLQMTVLPYLVLSLIAKTAQLNLRRSRRLGLTSLAVLLCLWGIGIALILAASMVLPPMQGASFFSPTSELPSAEGPGLFERFIPSNVFRSLADEAVPAVVVFCLFFGGALTMIQGKQPLVDFLEICSKGIGRINNMLVAVSPVGLFMLTAATAGTIRLEEVSRLQGYLIAFTLACALATLLIVPLLISSFSKISYREILRSLQEPLLTAIATGKLLIVLPQITEKCEELVAAQHDKEGANADDHEESELTASILVPLAYSFPHLGKILAFIFITFAAWYVGQGLSGPQTVAMGALGTVSSFASPLVTIPLLLDQYHLPRDMFVLFILPGFLTTRLADAVGVMHLTALTVLVTLSMQGRLKVRWRYLGASVVLILLCLAVGVGASRWYLASTSLEYNLDDRLLSMSVPNPHKDVIVLDAPPAGTERGARSGSTLDRIRAEKTIRVGFNPDHLPYSFFSSTGELVGLDIDLMHRLATRLDVKLEFIPYTIDNVIDQLETGVIDIAVGGLVAKPERLLQVGFSEAYQTATIAIVMPDYRRSEIASWDDAEMGGKLRLAVAYKDLVAPARRELPNAEIVVIDSIRSFFSDADPKLDGIIMQAEEAAAWNILHPNFAVIVPQPVVRRPVAMAVSPDDSEWRQFVDGWLEFERLDGSLDRLREYWIYGGGAKDVSPRWCILRDVLHWVD